MSTNDNSTIAMHHLINQSQYNQADIEQKAGGGGKNSIGFTFLLEREKLAMNE